MVPPVKHSPHIGPLPDHLKPDPFIKCMDACDKVEHELLQLICRVACLFTK